MSLIYWPTHKRNSGNICSFKHCTSTTFTTRDVVPTVSFYRFPVKDINRCKEWIVKSGCDELFFDYDVSKLNNRRVCSRHFTPSQIVGRRLCQDAVPSWHDLDPNAAVNDRPTHTDSTINCQRDIKLSEGESIEVTRSRDVRYYRPVPTSRRRPLETWDSKQVLERLESNIDCENSNDRHVLETQIKIVGGPQKYESRQDIKSIRGTSRLYPRCDAPHKPTDDMLHDSSVSLQQIEEVTVKMEPIEYCDVTEQAVEPEYSLFYEPPVTLQVEEFSVKMEPVEYDKAVESMNSLQYEPPVELHVEDFTVKKEPVEYVEVIEPMDSLQYEPPVMLQRVDENMVKMEPIEYDDVLEQTMEPMDSSLDESLASLQQIEEVTVKMEVFEGNDDK